jgi:hypothetical protein
MEKKADALRFDTVGMTALLKEMNADQKGVNLQNFCVLCNNFVKLSGNLGSLVAWGFDGTPRPFTLRHQ